MAKRWMEPGERELAGGHQIGTGWPRRRQVGEAAFDPIEGPAPFSARRERRSRHRGGFGAHRRARWRRRDVEERGFDPIDGPAPFGVTTERRSRDFPAAASA